MANPEDLGRYRLKRLLGRGILGEVWEASDREENGARIALKIMHAADDELVAARIHFAREARIASLIRHPHFVNVHDAGEAAGTSFLVMDMVDGRSLRAVLGEGSGPSVVMVTERLSWMDQIAQALMALHGSGLAHRDVKPENVIVRGDRTACLVDLGVSKWTKFNLGGVAPDSGPDLALPVSPEPAMPPEYVPPEMTKENVYDELGDQYAWGVLGYELLTGELPREDAPALADRPGIPKGAARVIDRARAPRRTERWDAMSDVVAELGAALAEAPEPAPSPPKVARRPAAPAPPSDVPPWIVAFAIAFIVAVAAMLVALR
jgi:serine/threonine-protein kinase